ncbi:unnamed protein product [Peniophora sp. CBMAI 1063]|nr:unnamed protein product [Peniophora sp. CBMAI 1063]
MAQSSSSFEPEAPATVTEHPSAKSSAVELEYSDKTAIQHFDVAAKPDIEELVVTENDVPEEIPPPPPGGYKLYKRRWAGLFALFALDAVVSIGTQWFGPIGVNVSEQLGYTTLQVNWLGNISSCAYLVVAFLIPIISRRWGISCTAYTGALLLLLSAWIRYAGTARSLSPGGSYALVLIGQFLGGLSQPFFQVISPKYSELWFDVETRTTATMVIALANPIGAAVGALIAPVYTDTRHGILILSIISTSVVPLALLIFDKPPTPPTFSGSKPSPGLRELLKALMGREVQESAHMSGRERIDFGILVWIFATLSAATEGFSRTSAHWLIPYGYTGSQAGLFTSVLLLAGIAAALITSPLLDRVLTNHIAATMRVLCPIVGALWLSLIWAVKADNAPALFAIFALIGACAVSLIPIAVELGVELTRNPAGSSAILRFVANLFSIIFVQSMGALIAPVTAKPPKNMHQAIIFNGAWTFASSFLVLFLRGRQARRERDVAMARVGAAGEDGEDSAQTESLCTHDMGLIVYAC